MQRNIFYHKVFHLPLYIVKFINVNIKLKNVIIYRLLHLKKRVESGAAKAKHPV